MRGLLALALVVAVLCTVDAEVRYIIIYKLIALH